MFPDSEDQNSCPVIGREEVFCSLVDGDRDYCSMKGVEDDCFSMIGGEQGSCSLIVGELPSSSPSSSLPYSGFLPPSYLPIQFSSSSTQRFSTSSSPSPALKLPSS